MTVPGAQIAASAARRDWQAVRDSGEIQFAPVPPVKTPETPTWLRWLGELLRDALEPLGAALGMSWPVLEKVLIAAAALLILVLLWRLFGPLLNRSRPEEAASTETWMPDRHAAIGLLEEADRLAAEGRYGEAVHLLLQRSVDHIAEARPEWLLPASTAREIATFPMLPPNARNAFREIAARVERSLFALRDLDARDWQAARAAYANFALVELRA